VTDASADPVHGTGFVMTGCDPAGFDDAMARALRMWREQQRWRRIQANGMARHFGWEDSAMQYVEVYERAAMQASGGTPEGPVSGAGTGTVQRDAGLRG